MSLLAILWPTRWVAAVAYGLQWAVFCLHAWPYRSERLYDLTGSASYISCTLISLLSQPERNLARPFQRQQLVSACFLVWSGRLGYFLFSRIQRDGGVDRRFARLRTNAPAFLTAWTVQGTWVYLVGLPAYVLNTMAAEDTPLTALDVLGLLVWACGLAVQAVADAQKTAFRADPLRKGQFITTGLWALSRHPNYLGEITLHCGLALVAATGLPPGDRLIAVVPPLFTAMLLLFVSGVPLLEKAADKRWGHLEAYREYKESTGMLLPYPSSLWAALAGAPRAKRE